MSNEDSTVLALGTQLATTLNSTITLTTSLTSIPNPPSEFTNINRHLHNSLSATTFFLARHRNLSLPDDDFLINLLRDYIALINRIHSKLYQVELLSGLNDVRVPERITIPLECEEWRRDRGQLLVFEQRIKATVGPWAQQQLDQISSMVAELKGRSDRDHALRGIEEVREAEKWERFLGEFGPLREDVSILRRGLELFALEEVHRIGDEWERTRRRSVPGSIPR